MTLFFSSPIGLGHITRDIAIVKEIAKSFNYYDFSFITGSKAFDFISIENDSSEKSKFNAHNLYFPPEFSIDDGRLNNSFLWFDLGARDPLFILPVVAGITTFIQQKMMMAGNANQNPQMAMMLWVMPIMIVVFAINFPAALSLYWVVGNLFMIIQTYFIKGPDLKQANIEGVKK